MYDCDRGSQVGEEGGKKAMGCGGEWRRLCTILDKRGKRKKISLNSEGQNWGERLNMEIRNLVQVSLLTVFSLQSDSLAPPFASLRLGARPSLFLGLNWPGLRYGTLPILTALCARKAVPPSGLRFHRSLPRIFPDAWRTLLHFAFCLLSPSSFI